MKYIRKDSILEGLYVSVRAAVKSLLGLSWGKRIFNSFA